MSEDGFKSVENLLSQISRDQALEAESSIADILPMLEKENRKKFPAELFRMDFLSVFKGEKTNKEIEEGNYMSIWIAIAGGPHLPVDLIDDSGTIVAIVPALINADKFNKNSSEDDRGVFENAAREMADLRVINPRLAMGRYLQRLIPYADSLTRSENEILQDDKWNQLFDYFNNGKTTVKAKVIDNLSDAFVYD